jgi:hypothetical protein
VRSPIFALCAVLIAGAANAAEITRVASSFEENDPFGMFIDVGYQFTRERGKIVREWYQENDLIDVTELRYQMVDHRLAIDAHLGIYRGLEFHFGMPIIFQQDRSWFYAVGTGPSNSTIANNCIGANGMLVSPATNPPGVGNGRACTMPQPLIPDAAQLDSAKGFNSYRFGIGDLTFGLKWAVLNQKKDESNPTWVLGYDWVAPVADAINPSIQTSEMNKGPVGDKVHRHKFYSSISKRIAFADPYFSLFYTLPFRAGGAYSNCDNPDSSRMARPENCGMRGWERASTVVQPPHVGGFLFGSELNAYENVNKHQKVALDVRLGVTYVSEGRYYNELSDLLRKLLYNSDYIQLMTQFGIVGHAAEFIQLKGYVTLSYNTERTLTTENIGKDLTGNGLVDLTDHPEEINPNFDYRVDRVGRRFRMQEDFVVRLFIQATFAF